MPSLYSHRGAKRAREAREALNLPPDRAVPDLVQVVEGCEAAHVVVLELMPGIAGAYARRPECSMIFVNGTHAIARQRFTLAHEFAHHRLGHDSVVDRVATIGAFQHDPVEVEANAFAAEFLIPKSAVAAWGETNVRGQVTLEDIVVLSYEYGVSAQAARYALEAAGVLHDEKRAEMLDREIAEELHFDIGPRLGLDPLRDQLSEAATRLPRIPPALADSVIGDLLLGELDLASAAERLNASEADVQAMLESAGLAQLLPLRA